MLQTELETWAGAGLEEKMSLFLNQLIESQCFQVIGVEEPNCECGTRL